MFLRTSALVGRDYGVAAILAACLMLSTGCSKSNSTESGATGDPAAAPAADGAAVEQVRAPVRKDDGKFAKAMEEHKAKEQAKAQAKGKGTKRGDKKGDAAPAAAATAAKFSTEDPAQWTIDDLKTAVAKKDARYSQAVMMHSVKSAGNPQAGAGLATLLASVASMPADGAAKAPIVRRGKGKRGDDEDEQATMPATPAAGAVPQPAAPAAAPGAPVDPNNDFRKIPADFFKKRRER